MAFAGFLNIQDTIDKGITTYSEPYIYERRGLTPREYLKLISGDDFYLLDRISLCESGRNPNAKNKNSTASGYFQFIYSTWERWGEGEDVFDPYANINATYRLFRAQGTGPWTASYSCWSQWKHTN